MARGLCPTFELEASHAGHLTPVYFGSALNNFSVRELLRGVAELAPPPRPQPARGTNGTRPISPDEPDVAGFVFKVQANIDPSTALATRLWSGSLGRLPTRVKFA